ncbi:MAG: NfeD family protein [Thermodesulfobacteriota bacterium]
MTSQMILPILLQVAGMAVLVAEILLPSGGVLTIIAVGLLGYSLYQVFAAISVAAGMAFVAADIVILPIVGIAGMKLLARSPLALRSSLSKTDGVVSYDEKLADYLGKQGVALTDMRPAGTAKIEGERVDVVTRGDYIEKGDAVEVSRVEGGRVVVRKKKERTE